MPYHRPRQHHPLPPTSQLSSTPRLHHRTTLYRLASNRQAQLVLFCTLSILSILALCLGSATSRLPLHVTQRQRLLVGTTSNARFPWSADAILSQPFAANIIVSERNKLVFCPIPKAASSNWKYFIRKIERLPDYTNLENAHNRNASRLRYLTDYSSLEAHAILSNPAYFKFAFVRDPYMRLLSCYMDKFRNRDLNYTQTEYRSFLASAFSWRYARSVDIITEARPSFRSFVDAVVTREPQDMNQHWQPQHLLCGFGVMPYDFIGRMESLQMHVRHVLRVIGKERERFPTHDELAFPPSGASPRLARLIYSAELMFKVRLVYDRDFELLGYD